MIATILQSTPTFHAVAYNEKKVAEGSASLLEIKNFGDIDNLGYSNASELSEYLIDYSSRNTRIKEPQFHLAISCKGHEYTPEQLLDFAHKYLDEMGYGDPEQPLLVYEHHDTDNTHIHIVTSRVDPRGKKINDSNERRRSQKVLEKLLKTDMKAQANKDLNEALTFNFRKATQFRAIMEAMNYECYEKGDKICIKKGGAVQTEILKSSIDRIAADNASKYKKDVAECAKWREIFKKYRDINSSRAGFERDIKKLFGISLVFVGKKDTPYGYTAIDFNKKRVIEGSNIMPINQLLQFMTPEDHFAQIEEFIDNVFEENPFITTRELNKRLQRLGASITTKTNNMLLGVRNWHVEHYIEFHDKKKELSGVTVSLLERNDEIHKLNRFEVQSDEERRILCELTGWKHPEFIKIRTRPDGKYFCKDHEGIKQLLTIQNFNKKFETFLNSGYRMISVNGVLYLYCMKTETIVDLKRAGFNPSIYEDIARRLGLLKQQNSMSKEINKGNNAGNGKKAEIPGYGGSHYSNREWEVGKHSHDADDPDQNKGLSM